MQVKSHELNSQTNYALLKLQKPIGSFTKSNISTRANNVIVFDFNKNFLVETCPFMGYHWYPYFGLLVTSPLSFKARMGSRAFNWSYIFSKKISDIYELQGHLGITVKLWSIGFVEFYTTQLLWKYLRLRWHYLTGHNLG